MKNSLIWLKLHSAPNSFCCLDLTTGLMWFDSGVTVLDYAPQLPPCSSSLDKNVVFHSLKTYTFWESRKPSEICVHAHESCFLGYFHQLPWHQVSLIHLTTEPCLFPSLVTSGPLSFSLQTPGGPDLVWWLRVVWVCPPRCLWLTARPTTTLCSAERNRGGREWGKSFFCCW